MIYSKPSFDIVIIPQDVTLRERLAKMFLCPSGSEYRGVVMTKDDFLGKQREAISDVRKRSPEEVFGINLAWFVLKTEMFYTGWEEKFYPCKEKNVLTKRKFEVFHNSTLRQIRELWRFPKESKEYTAAKLTLDDIRNWLFSEYPLQKESSSFLNGVEVIE